MLRHSRHTLHLPYTPLFRSVPVKAEIDAADQVAVERVAVAQLLIERTVGKRRITLLSAELLRRVVLVDEAHRLATRSEEHTSELQSPCKLDCRILIV